MTKETKNHFLETGLYTYAGPYKKYFYSLPDNLQELVDLISHQIIHRFTLREGNTYDNSDLRYGDMNEFPWYRVRCEDDITENQFDWAAKVWLDIRSGKTDGKEFLYGDGLGTCSLKAVIRYLFYDFHALMNNEISYLFQPFYIDDKFDSLTEEDFQELDGLARLLLSPDENFEALQRLWETKRKFRILNSPLVGDWDNELMIR